MMTAMTNSRPPKKQKTFDPSFPGLVSGFTVLPIKLPSPLPSVPSAVHILYLRRHEEPPQPPAIIPTESPRTIFIVNVPIDSTKELLRGLFASLGGRLEDVRIHRPNSQENAEPENLSLPDTWDKRLCRSGSTAHITFPSSSDVDKILKSIAKERRNQVGPIREWGVGVDDPTSSLGLQRYLTHYKLTYPDKANLQTLVDTALTRFNAAESARMLSLKRLRSEPDEDGFITVTRRERVEPVVEKKNRAVNLEDFYKFQKREKREKRMEELRRKFEEDKIKVERMKQGRKFKPF